ncbi:MAG: hypothetical protein JWR37_778 [Mycobacterium sp.]|jgi:hypothetical protein|nr:hypothetical protein [Mycobacterium sp.]
MRFPFSLRSTAASPISYQAGTPANWEEGVAAFTINNDGGLAIVGPCPRCNERIRQPLGNELLPAFGTAQPQKVKVRVVCNCGTSHPGAPPEARGCGAEGGVEIER